jgi:hypothetical protein
MQVSLALMRQFVQRDAGLVRMHLDQTGEALESAALPTAMMLLCCHGAVDRERRLLAGSVRSRRSHNAAAHDLMSRTFGVGAEASGMPMLE